MNDTTADQPGTVALEPPSTVLNPETVKTASGGGQSPLSEDGGSIQDVLGEELARLKDEDKKAETEAKEKGEKAALEAKEKADAASKSDKDDKAQKPENRTEKSDKPAPAEVKDKDTAEADAKAAKGAAEKPATGQDGANVRQSEGRQHSEPPARFLPEARAKWPNVPNEVKEEFHRVSQEYEGEIAKQKAATERYETIRQFDEQARANGRELKDSLTKIVHVEQALARNPILGLEMIMREIGPRKPDGSPLSLYEVAQVISKQTPQQFQAAMQQTFGGQRPQQDQAQAPQNSALEKRLAQLETELATSRVQPVLEAFAAQHSDYKSLEPRIAEILKSGVIDSLYGAGLSPEQKLAEAYRMAGGQGPTSRSDAPQVEAGHSGVEPVPSADAGTKSIRGAPDNGADVPVEEDNSDLREMLRKDLRRISA